MTDRSAIYSSINIQPNLISLILFKRKGWFDLYKRSISGLIICKLINKNNCFDFAFLLCEEIQCMLFIKRLYEKDLIRCISNSWDSFIEEIQVISIEKQGKKRIFRNIINTKF